ncbi:MAG: MFS transporter [Mariprofundales bacterium]
MIGAFYGFYFSALALLTAYFPLYLANYGFSATIIGLLISCLSLARMFVPIIGTHLLDNTHDHRRHIMISSLIAACFFALMPWLLPTGNLFYLFTLLLIFASAWALSLPLVDHVAVMLTEHGRANYGRLRLWGSIGFIISTLGGGLLFTDDYMPTLPIYIVIFILLAAITPLKFPSINISHDNIKHLSKWQAPHALKSLLAINVLVQLSHGAMYGFFSLYMANLGFSAAAIGACWAVAVISEIVIMARYSLCIQNAAPASMLAICIIASSVRWLGISFSESWWALAAWSLLHAATFAAFHINCVMWVRRLAPAHKQVSAQGWYTASGFGFGAAAGIIISGFIIDMSNFQTAFLFCSIIALLALPLCQYLPKEAHK